jgi:hypothetical protein
MALWRPDPTSSFSPKLAMQTPSGKLAFVAMLNASNDGSPDARGWWTLILGHPVMGGRSGESTCRTRGMNCTSVGTHAAHACVPTRRIHTWSGAT